MTGISSACPACLPVSVAARGSKKVTLHTLRHTFAATAAELGFSELTIAGLLGHSVPGVTARYAHVPDSALVAAADRVSARIAAALDGRSRPMWCHSAMRQKDPTGRIGRLPDKRGTAPRFPAEAVRRFLVRLAWYRLPTPFLDVRKEALRHICES